MLSNLLDQWFKLDVGEGAFYAVFGFVFVFLGIALLIAIIYLVGFVMTKVNARRSAKKETERPVPPAAPSAPVVEEGISPEMVAAITAALAVYMEEERARCDFVVRRIRRV